MKHWIQPYLVIWTKCLHYSFKRLQMIHILLKLKKKMKVLLIWDSLKFSWRKQRTDITSWWRRDTGHMLPSVSVVCTYFSPLTPSSSPSPGAAGCQGHYLWVDCSSCCSSFCFRLQSAVSPDETSLSPVAQRTTARKKKVKYFLVDGTLRSTSRNEFL